MIGRLAIDLRTGSIYGFPTDALGYPRNPGESETPVSDPILLGASTSTTWIEQGGGTAKSHLNNF